MAGIYILVEGEDDERFWNIVMVPALSKSYDYVMIWPHAQKKKTVIKKFIKSINAMGADYIYTCDIDNKSCVTSKKNAELKINSKIDPDKLKIVIYEIESWYIAVTESKLGKSFPNLTDSIRKEDLEKVVPKGYTPKQLKIELLENYNLKRGLTRNASLQYIYNSIV